MPRMAPDTGFCNRRLQERHEEYGTQRFRLWLQIAWRKPEWASARIRRWAENDISAGVIDLDNLDVDQRYNPADKLEKERGLGLSRSASSIIKFVPNEQTYKSCLEAAEKLDGTALVLGSRVYLPGREPGSLEVTSPDHRRKSRRLTRTNWAEEVDIDVVRTYPRDHPEGHGTAGSAPAITALNSDSLTVEDEQLTEQDADTDAAVANTETTQSDVPSNMTSADESIGASEVGFEGFSDDSDEYEFVWHECTFEPVDASLGANPEAPETTDAQTDGPRRRSFTANTWDEKIRATRNVLRAVAVRCPMVRYCQGMNLVAAFLLWASRGVEAAAFALMVGLIEEYELVDMWRPGLYKLRFCLFALDRLVKDRLPRLAFRFQAEGISMGMFSSRWFLTIFTSREVLRAEVVLRLWDAFMVDGVSILLSMALAILESLQDHLLQEDLSGILRALRLPREVLNRERGEGDVGFDADEMLFQKATQMRISEDLIRDLKADYHLRPSQEEDDGSIS